MSAMNSAPEQPLAGGRAVVTLDLRARLLDERPVLHAGRTGGDARQAAETRDRSAGRRTTSSRRALRGRPSSGRCARAASPSPRPTAGTSGHVGRQKPQWTHLSISAGDGVIGPLKAAPVGSDSDHVKSGPRPAFRIPAGSNLLLERARNLDRAGRRPPDVDLLLQLADPRAARRRARPPRWRAVADRGRMRAASSPSSRSSPAPTPRGPRIDRAPGDPLHVVPMSVATAGSVAGSQLNRRTVPRRRPRRPNLLVPQRRFARRR